MGLITGLLTLPLAPVRGVVWVAEQIQQEAERQWYDPGILQAELSDIEAMREAGVIDDAEADARENDIVNRLMSLQSGYVVPEEGTAEDV
jgi:hypothetical protein